MKRPKRPKKRRASRLRLLIGKPVLVEWTDASLAEGWKDRKEIVETPSDCETLGFLIAATRKVINVAQSQSGEGNTAEVMCIPTLHVKSIRRLKG
jgi:hypothetical protein